MPGGIQDLSSLTGDQACVPCGGSMASWTTELPVSTGIKSIGMFHLGNHRNNYFSNKIEYNSLKYHKQVY